MGSRVFPFYFSIFFNFLLVFVGFSADTGAYWNKKKEPLHTHIFIVNVPFYFLLLLLLCCLSCFCNWLYVVFFFDLICSGWVLFRRICVLLSACLISCASASLGFVHFYFLKLLENAHNILTDTHTDSVTKMVKKSHLICIWVIFTNKKWILRDCYVLHICILSLFLTIYAVYCMIWPIHITIYI